MQDYSQFIPEAHFERIPIKNLVSNQVYQRILSELHVKRTVANYDPYQINPVKVSRRDGTNYVVNGQHTIEIIAAVSCSREIPVWCMIYDDLDYKQEADIFANQQKNLKSLTPYEIFMANVEAGNDEQLIIKDLVESYGLVLSPTKIPGGICAISTLEYLNRKYGFHLLNRTLRLCIGTWEGDINSLKANILRGTSKLLVAYGDDLKDDIFKEKVGRCSIKELSRTAAERKAGSLGYAEAMLLVYNKKQRTPLRWSKLYKTKGNEQKEQEELSEYEEESNTEDFNLKVNF
jgi:hypothetical protein